MSMALILLLLFGCLVLSAILVNVSFSLLKTAFLTEQARAVVEGSSDGIIEIIKSCISNNEFLVIAFSISFFLLSLYLYFYCFFKV